MIEQLIIENYKSIRDAQLKLNKLNVLIGSNGVGKSNLISSFELFNALLNQRLGSYILGYGGMDGFLYQGAKVSDHIHFLIDFNNTNAFSFTLKPSNGNKAYIETSGDYFNGMKDNLKNYKSWHWHLWDDSEEESRIINEQGYRAGYLRKYLSSFTVFHFHDTSRTSYMRKECKIGDNEQLRHDASNLAAYLYKLQQTEPRSFKLIEGVIQSIAPYFKKFVLRENPLKEGFITLEWEENHSDAYRDAYSFSDGTLRFIALATLLLQENTPNTIIIDEPELGLHPTAINKLSALIRRASNNSQIILATQSVNLVNCFEPEDIVVVDREDNQTVFKHLERNQLDVWLEDYNIGDIWEKNIFGGQP